VSREKSSGLVDDGIKLNEKKKKSDNVGSEKKISLFNKNSIKDGCKQVYDKANYCVFSGQCIKSKISRHLFNVHKDERDVLEMIGYCPNAAKSECCDCTNSQMTATSGTIQTFSKKARGTLSCPEERRTIRAHQQNSYLVNFVTNLFRARDFGDTKKFAGVVNFILFSLVRQANQMKVPKKEFWQ
jgi:hypothetical protein